MYTKVYTLSELMKVKDIYKKYKKCDPAVSVPVICICSYNKLRLVGFHE